eukprot:gene5454-10961_t
MSHGDPALLLSYCREYWDGDSITPLTAEDRKEVLGVYQRWDLEDFDVVAFGYTPVPYILHHHILKAKIQDETTISSSDNNNSNNSNYHATPAQSNCLFFVEPSTEAEIQFRLERADRNKTENKSYVELIRASSADDVLKLSTPDLKLNLSLSLKCSPPKSGRSTGGGGLGFTSDLMDLNKHPPIREEDEDDGDIKSTVTLSMTGIDEGDKREDNASITDNENDDNESDTSNISITTSITNDPIKTKNENATENHLNIITAPATATDLLSVSSPKTSDSTPGPLSRTLGRQFSSSKGLFSDSGWDAKSIETMYTTDNSEIEVEVEIEGGFESDGTPRSSSVIRQHQQSKKYKQKITKALTIDNDDDNIIIDNNASTNTNTTNNNKSNNLSSLNTVVMPAAGRSPLSDVSSKRSSSPIFDRYRSSDDVFFRVDISPTPFSLSKPITIATSTSDEMKSYDKTYNDNDKNKPENILSSNSKSPDSSQSLSMSLWRQKHSIRRHSDPNFQCIHTDSNNSQNTPHNIHSHYNTSSNTNTNNGHDKIQNEDDEEESININLIPLSDKKNGIEYDVHESIESSFVEEWNHFEYMEDDMAVAVTNNSNKVTNNNTINNTAATTTPQNNNNNIHITNINNSNKYKRRLSHADIDRNTTITTPNNNINSNSKSTSSKKDQDESKNIKSPSPLSLYTIPSYDSISLKSLSQRQKSIDEKNKNKNINSSNGNMNTTRHSSNRHSSHSHSHSHRSRRSLGDLLCPLMRQQVFLGVTASSVPVKPEIPQLVEDLTSAGVRFVYFSPRNMRRSKPTAEKIGLQTDWNCAISLRDLDNEQQEDPHRYISNYADWDVKARLPHGVEAIKRHLKEVDNVPLLVSLYTDSKPKSIRDNGEVVMTVGSSHRAHNFHLFAAADVGVSVALLPGDDSAIPAEVQKVVDRFPKHSDKSLCQADLVFNFSLISLHTIPLLQTPCSGTSITSTSHKQHQHQQHGDQQHGDNQHGHQHQHQHGESFNLYENMNRTRNRNGIEEEDNTQGAPNNQQSAFYPFSLNDPSHINNKHFELENKELALMSLLEAIRAGRVFLLNAMQAMGFLCVSILSISLWPILAQTIPMSVQPTLPPPITILFLCVYLPMLLLAMLFTPAHEHVLRTCPRKNVLNRRWRDEFRFIKLLSVRSGYVALSVCLIGWMSCYSLVVNTKLEDNRYFGYFLQEQGILEEFRLTDLWLIQDVMSCELLLSLISQLMTMLHRGQSFLQGPERWPTYYPLFFLSVILCLITHVTLMVIRDDGFIGYTSLDTSVWVILVILPLLGLPLGYVCNSIDDKWYKRHLQFLRLEFDTRLG